MNNFKFLLIGTSLSLIPLTANAQCVATQDCATLGYTETSCNGGKGVKCPFGNKWACLPTKESICKEEGFTLTCNETGQIGEGDSCNGLYKKCSCDSSYQYTCSGTGYSGGSGFACNGKYTTCICTEQYKWENGKCEPKMTDGAHGNLFYCNGEVIGVKTANMNFYIAMKNFDHMDWDDANETCLNYSFCNNLKGTLPTMDQLDVIYNNKSTINNLLLANNGKKLKDEWYWSSTYLPYSSHYILNMDDGMTGNGATFFYDGYMIYTRPILTSW